MAAVKARKTVADFLRLFSAKLIVKFLGIFSVAFFARYLTKSDLAMIPAFAMLGGMSTLFFNFGMFPTLLKLVPSLNKTDPEKALRITKTIILVAVINSILFGTISWFAAEKMALWVFDDAKYQGVMEIFSLGFVSLGFNSLNQNLFKAFSRFKELSFILVFRDVIRFILTIVLTITYGPIGLAYGLAISSIVSEIISIWYLRQLYFNPSGLFSFRELIKESWAFYLESYLMYFRREGDDLVVTFILGPEALAIYYVAKKAFQIVDGLFVSMDNVITVKLSTFRDSIDKFVSKAQEFQLIGSHIILPAVMALSACLPTLVPLVAGPGFQEAIIPAVLLCFSPLFYYYFALSYGRAIFLFMKSFDRLKLTLINSVFLIVLLLIFSPFLGVVGVSLAKALTALLIGLVSYTLVNKNLFTLKVNFKDILVMTAITAVSLVPVLICQWLYPMNIPIMILALLASLGMFLLSIHFTIANKFYATANLVSPYKLKDPLMFLAKTQS